MHQQINLRQKAWVLAALSLVVFFAGPAVYALGGYWAAHEGQAYLATFTDEHDNIVTGEFRGQVEWTWKNEGGVTLDEWDSEATFIYKSSDGEEHKIPNAEMKDRIVDLSPSFTGKIRGNIIDVFSPTVTTEATTEASSSESPSGQPADSSGD